MSHEWPETVFIGDTMKKPTRLPTLKQAQTRDGLRTVFYWALLYIIAVAVVLADCIVWRP
jgi:hypothetical protein